MMNYKTEKGREFTYPSGFRVTMSFDCCGEEIRISLMKARVRMEYLLKSPGPKRFKSGPRPLISGFSKGKSVRKNIELVRKVLEICEKINKKTQF